MKSVALVEMLTDWLGEGMIPVPLTHAQERANVCLKCPMNEEGRIDEWFKAPIAKFIKKQIETKNGMGLRVSGEKGLHICSACGCSLKLKPHVPAKHLAEITDSETLAKFHPMCWLPKELDEYHKQWLGNPA